ncbi:MAG: hypothetical protein K2X90_04185 [Candidatus Babeliaceae bacterium]|nr:hypothetical protein [Candidatus Babeliaceae bacterium]
MKHNKQGFVLVMALFIISLGSVLVTSLLQPAIAFNHLHRALVKQQHARMLALNGLEIARAQLSNPLEIDKKTIDQNIVPFLYTDIKQIFTLKHESDGIDGTIMLYISCEEGKINLNKSYDFQEKKFIKLDKEHDAQSLLALINTIAQQKFSFENFSQKMGQFFQERTQPLEDITEATMSKLSNDIFYALDSQDTDYVAFTDLFTLAGSEFKIQPLYISSSWARAMGLDKQNLDKKQRMEIVKKIQALKAPINWATAWKELLAALFKKEYTVLPDSIKKILASKIEVTAFNVISYGTVDDGAGMPVTQKVCAYLEKSMNQQKATVYTIKRLYWL